MVTVTELPNSASSASPASSLPNGPCPSSWPIQHPKNSRTTTKKSVSTASSERPQSSSLASARLLPGPFVMLALLLLAQFAEADVGGLFPGQNEWEEHRICGRLLINALKTVCNHQYVQPTREQLYDNYYKSTGMVFRARRGQPQTAALIGGGGARRRRGIIWECCTNKCSLNYIRNNYCAQGPVGDGPIPSWQFVEDASRR